MPLIPVALEWLAALLAKNRPPGHEHLNEFGKALIRAFDANQPNKRIGEACSRFKANHPSGLDDLLTLLRAIKPQIPDSIRLEACQQAIDAVQKVQEGLPATKAFGMGRRPGPTKGFASSSDAAFLCRYIELVKKEELEACPDAQAPSTYAIQAVGKITGCDQENIRKALSDSTFFPATWDQVVNGAALRLQKRSPAVSYTGALY